MKTAMRTVFLKLVPLLSTPVLLGLALGGGTADSAAASPAGSAPVGFDFADWVAERNLAPTGVSMETFGSGGDTVSRFNGALGYRIPIGPTYPVGGRLSYQLWLRYTSSVWDFHPDGSGMAAEPGERFQAGLGWTLSLSELLGPSTPDNPSNFWVHIGSDGERTRFYTTLHDGEPTVAGVFYSRDGNYQRLQIAGGSAVVEDPDGTREVYSPVVGPQTASWRLTSRQDSLGNRLDFAYAPTVWTLSDSHGREHRIHFVADPAGTYPQVVDRIEMAAFGGATATWSFTYATHAATRPSQDTSSNTPAAVAVPLLAELSLPGGESFVFDSMRNGTPEDGRLGSVRLPTGGALEYRYGEIPFPYLAGAEHAADAVGVDRRSAKDLTGAVMGLWSFAWSLDRPRVPGAIDQPRELTVTQTYPDGHRREHKFSVYVSGDDAAEGGGGSFDPAEYGLPLTRNRSSGSDHPSWTVYDAGGKALRSHRLRYELDPCAGCFDANPRVVRRRTVFHDDGERSETTGHSGFDGLGHFAVTERWDSSGSAPRRTVTTTVSGSRPAQGDPWILGLATSRTESEAGGESKTVETCFDPATGLPSRTRIRARAAQSSQDLLRTYEMDGDGNLAVTRFYGGEVQPLAAGSLCSLPLPGPEQFARFTEYRYGSPSRAGWLAADGSVFVETLVATIDPNTGLAATSHQGDEFVWTYGYDARGRRTAAIPPTGQPGATTVVFTPVQEPGTGRAVASQVHVVSRAADGTVQAEEKTHRGPLGRIIRHELKTPDGWLATVTDHDAQGRRTAITAPGGFVTRYLGHDPFGRPSTVRPPDGSAHDRTFAYLGDRVTVETVPIGKRWDEPSQSVIEVARTTTTTRDFLGRVVRRAVTDADGDSRTETFTHNLEGEVLSTTVTDGTRTETTSHPDLTDFRGFRIADGAGNPVGPYDALGHLTRVDHGQGPLLRTFDRAGRPVDQIEPDGTLWTRNTYATSNAPGTFRKGKLHASLRINRNVPHVPDGRIVVRDQYLYTGPGSTGGEVQTTVIAGNGGSMPLFRFITEIETDPAGETVSLRYPDCDPTYSAPAGHCEPTAARTVRYHSQLGRLSAVTATVDADSETWIASIDYDTGGFLTRRVLGNGLIEIRDPHASGAGRLARMRLDDPAGGTRYDSGSAVYDGRGRLVQLGPQRRISDRAYSLALSEPPGDAAGTVILPPITGPRDVFGNPTRRSYQVPIRPGVGSSDGVEDVWEVYVYGPGERQVWKRMFNDYEAWNYNRSQDTWFLADPTGRTLRARVGSSEYQGTLQVTWANAQLTGVRITPALTDNLDRVYLGSELLGSSDGRFSPHRVEHFHYDFQGRLFAVSDQDGEIRQNRTLLH